MKKIYYLIFLVPAISGCSGKGSSTETPINSVVENNTQTPSNIGTRNYNSIIENEDVTQGISGVDENKNGIRDDIDRLISKKYSGTPQLKKATEQTAKSLQQFMEANTRQEVLIQGDKNARASACLSKQLPPQNDGNTELYLQATKEIEALTANTKERFEKYWKSNDLAGGAVFSQPTELVCD